MFLGFQGLLIASAAFEEEEAWAEWLKEQLSRLAGLLPAGKASSRLYYELQELKKVTKLISVLPAELRRSRRRLHHFSNKRREGPMTEVGRPAWGGFIHSGRLCGPPP